MKELCIVIVITIAASSLFAAASCCSTELHGQKKSASVSVADDGVVTREQIDETIAVLTKMKERIPSGQDSISIREVMIMQMEDIKKSPEYAKMSDDERKRLDAAIKAARRTPEAETREEGIKKPAATVPTHGTVEISDGTRAFFMPKQRMRPASARKRRK